MGQSRRVVVTLEMVTEQSLRDLRSARWWGEVGIPVEQAEANVVEPRKRPARATRARRRCGTR